MIQDVLTGAFSRSSFDERFKLELENARARGESLSLLMIEPDHFKSINDGFGHARGDQVLIELVQRLQKTIRAADVLFRYGGDEFVLLAPQTPKERGVNIGQRLLEAVMSPPFPGSPPLTITLSIGVATFPQEVDSADALFAKADARSYIAKRTGRARVVGEDQVSTAESSFTEVARLIEREVAVQTLQSFISLLSEQNRGILGVIGPVGSGRSRFLDEVEQTARLRGYAVLRMDADSSLKTKPNGVLMKALTGLLGAIPTFPLNPAEVERQLESHLIAQQHRGSIIIVDNLIRLDPSTFSYVRHLLQFSNLLTVALVYTADQNLRRRIALPAVTFHDVVEIAPYSAEGVRVWLRMAMQWEAPQAFVEWLTRETGGLAAALQRALAFLVNQHILTRTEKDWTINGDYAAIELDKRLGLKIRAAPNNLPEFLTTFIGRDQEIAVVKQHLSETRLLTLSGAAGTGKTRLALQIAADLLDEFLDGAFFVDLAPVRDHTFVFQTIARTLGLSEIPNQPYSAKLKEHLRNKQMLLVLDNFEQVIDAAPVVNELLMGAPHLKVLVTSRTVLHIKGEKEYTVPPLTVPDPKQFSSLEELTHYTAVQLFLERARPINPEFKLNAENASAVAEICYRLEGLPLAIELVAARVRYLTPPKILSHLENRLRFLVGSARDLPERQRTMKSAIEWSYDLLRDPEKKWFRRLAVFAGGCTLESAEPVCKEESDGDVLRELESLVDKSLLQPSHQDDEYRFTMLEVIREYALEQLTARGDAEALRRRHARYFMQWAETIEPKLLGAEQARALIRLETEHDNFRSALYFSLNQSDLETALRLCAALWRFWRYRGHLSEGRRWLEETLRQSANDAAWRSSYVRARALGGAGALARVQIDFDRARAFHLEALEILRGQSNQKGVSTALNSLGLLSLDQGDYVRAKVFFEEGLALDRETGDGNSLAVALNNLAGVAFYQKDWARAETLLRESINLRKTLGDEWGIANGLMNLGEVLHLEDKDADARSVYQQSLRVSRKLGDRLSIAALLEGLATLACSGGQSARAATLFGASEMLREMIHAPIKPADLESHKQNVVKLRAQLDEADFNAAWKTGRAMTPEQAVEYALEETR